MDKTPSQDDRRRDRAVYEVLLAAQHTTVEQYRNKKVEVLEYDTKLEKLRIQYMAIKKQRDAVEAEKERLRVNLYPRVNTKS